jgi:hypothetical protein
MLKLSLLIHSKKKKLKFLLIIGSKKNNKYIMESYSGENEILLVIF